MRRRSGAGGEPVKTRRRKAMTLKRRNAPKAVRSSSDATHETEVARLTRERDEALQRQTATADENARLLNELRQRTTDLTEALEQQTGTSEVLRVISSSGGELEPVFQALLENAIRICEAKFGVLFRMYDGVSRPIAMIGVPAALATFLQGGHRPGPNTIQARAMRAGCAIHFLDVRKEKGYLEGDPIVVAGVDKGGTRTIVAVPMLKDKVPIGTIVIYRTEVQPFTDKQIALLTNFGAQAVIAIENARLLNELRESLQQQTATADVLKVISRSPFDLQTVLDTLVQSAGRLCEAEIANIWLPKDDAYRVAASSRSKEYLENKESLGTVALEPNRGTIVGRTLLECKTVHVHDVQADPDYNPNFILVVGSLGGFRTVLGVPLLSHGTPIGVIALSQSKVCPFTEKQIKLVGTFADQAVIAIEYVRLFEAEQQRTRELTKSLEQQTATSEVLQVISRSTFDLQNVLNTLVESVARLCEADRAVILRPTGMDGSYYVAARYGHPPEFDEYVKSQTFAAGRSGVTSRVLMEGKSVQIPDVLVDPEYALRELARVGNFRTILGVPLLREGTIIGVLLLQREAVRPFMDKQIELAETFADQAVIAIENTRLFEAEQLRSRELAEIAGAADSNVGSSPGHQQLSRRPSTGVCNDAGERRPHLRRYVWKYLSLGWRCLEHHCVAQHTQRLRRASKEYATSSRAEKSPRSHGRDQNRGSPSRCRRIGGIYRTRSGYRCRR